MSVFNNFFHVKQSPLLSMLGFGGGGTGLAIGGGGGATASGGTVHTPGNGYNYHVFVHSSANTATSPDPISGGFQISGGPIANCDVLVVAGGGGGGSGYYGGGGGGSGVIVGTGLDLPEGTYNIEVACQGSKGLYPPGPSSGSDGGRSVFGDIILLGGGFGGSGPGGASEPGSTTGSNAGGGSAYTPSGTSNPYTVPTPYQPYGTWTVNIHSRPAATAGSYGGDGAGGGAVAPTPGLRGGGVGVAVPQFAGPLIPTIAASIPLMGPTTDYYGGGGSGYNYPSGVSGGFGGGGAGSPGNVANPAARYHLGGGGGGSGNPRGNGGLGGSGCVMVRVPV